MAKRLPLADLIFPTRDVTAPRLMGSLSVAETGPPGENLVSNEDSYPRVAGELRRRVAAGGVYLGVGPDQNFTMIAHGRPALGFILDYRRRNALVHLYHKALFALSETRVDYLGRLTARFPKTRLDREAGAEDLIQAFQGVDLDRSLLEATRREVFRYLAAFGGLAEADWPAIAAIQGRLAGPGLASRFLGLPGYASLSRMIATVDNMRVPSHFLAREDLYESVRRMQLDDRILPLVGDFGGGDGLAKIAWWLDLVGLGLSVVYLSDVEFFLIRAGKLDTFAAQLSKIPRRDGAVIVRTSTRPIDHPGRVAGDSSTTIVRDLAEFVVGVDRGSIRSIDDLFAP